MPEIKKQTSLGDELFQLGPLPAEYRSLTDPPATENPPQEAGRHPQSIEDILLKGEQPTAEFLAEFIALHEAPPLSDEELEQQALEAPGDDGDPATPE